MISIFQNKSTVLNQLLELHPYSDSVAHGGFITMDTGDWQIDKS